MPEINNFSNANSLEELNKLIDSNKFVVYGDTSCPHSRRAGMISQSLDSKSTFIKRDKEKNNLFEELKNKYNHKTIPFVFYDKVFVGGRDNFEEIIKNGGLKKEYKDIDIKSMQS